MKSTRYEAFLPPPIVYDKIKPTIWIQNLKNKKSVAPLSLKAILKIYPMKNFRKLKKNDSLKYKRKLASWKLISQLLPEMQHGDVEKKSRSKRSSVANSKSDQESNPTGPERQKRSDGNLPNLKYPNRFLPAGNSKYLPNLAMFYRHPELSVEEQHQQLNETLAESKKSRKAREDNRIPKLKPHKPLYTPVFKECNDTTAASEVEDLNLPPPRPKYLKRKLPYIPDIDTPAGNDPLSLKPDPSKFDGSFPKISKIEDMFNIKRPKMSIWESLKRVDPKNVTYGNLRDHQAEAKKSILADGRMKMLPNLSIPAIPRNPTYVNLRDHQAEAKKSILADGPMKTLPNLAIPRNPTYVNLRDHQAEAKKSILADGPMKMLPDLAIPTVPRNPTYVNLRDHQAEAKKSILADGPMKMLPDLAIPAIPRNPTYVNLRDHQAEAKKSFTADGGMKILPDVPMTATPLYPKDIPPYNPDNIPYVEVPDYTDLREESLDEHDRRVAKERYTNLEAGQLGGSLVTDKSKDLEPDVPVPSAGLPHPVTTETLLQEGYTVGGDERSESVDQPLSKDLPNDDGAQKLQLPEVLVEDVQIEKTVDDEDKSIEDKSPRKDDDAESVVDFQPVHFDINDYIKPFEYDKLFEVNKKKFSEELKDDSKEISGSERIESDVTTFPDHFTQSYRNVSPDENSTKADGKNSSEDITEVPIIKPEEFYFGSKDFFKPISEEERNKSDRFASGSDFLARYFNDDVDDKLEKDSVDKTEQDYESRDSSNPTKEEAYTTLSSSLEQKDYSPKFDTGSKETEKDDEVPPRKYHDFWRLEYTFPPQKINSGLQESIDEENKKNLSS